MTQAPNEKTQRDVQPVEEPLDAANQSLADAMRASFSVLKAIMAVLVVLYLGSNVRSIADHEQALVMRLGELRPGVHEAGLMWAFPFPIDEIVPLPTRKSNEIRITSHTFYRRPNERGKPLSFLTRSAREGLHPTLDGALLTADAGLVHVQWKVTYKIDDVEQFVRTIRGDNVESAEILIQTLVETVGITVAGEFTAEEFIRTKTDIVQGEMRRRINERLDVLESGIHVTFVEMFEPTPPLQVRRAFDAKQSAENAKQQQIRARQQEANKILSEVAGAAHKKLVKLLRRIDLQRGDAEKVTRLRAEFDLVLENEAEGLAGKLLQQAGSYRATALAFMESDVQEYRALLPEYRRNPHMLINRLWEATKLALLSSPGVTKYYRPPGLKEYRIMLELDPVQSRLSEQRRLQEKQFNVDDLLPTRMVPVGPEYD